MPAILSAKDPHLNKKENIQMQKPKNFYIMFHLPIIQKAFVFQYYKNWELL